ncbi:MAG: BLUF domain-containing protein [Salinarimonas sp.]
MLSRSSHSRIIYYSRSVLDNDPEQRKEQIANLIRTSRRQNEFSLMTSILVHDKGWFTQMLEGDRDALNQTFNRITQDSRHKEVRIVEWREVPRRELLPSLELIDREAGFNDILDRYNLEEAYTRGTPKAGWLREFIIELQSSLLAKRGIEVLT